MCQHVAETEIKAPDAFKVRPGGKNNQNEPHECDLFHKISLTCSILDVTVISRL